MLDRFSIAEPKGPDSSSRDRVLVAGIGNIFFGDDGFGVEVARRLACEKLPARVRVTELGLEAERLKDELAAGYATVVLIDSLERGDAPGTLFVAESDMRGDPAAARALVRRVIVIGCEPAELVGRMGLSEPVRRAVDDAVRVVRALVGDAGTCWM